MAPLWGVSGGGGGINYILLKKLIHVFSVHVLRPSFSEGTISSCSLVSYSQSQLHIIYEETVHKNITYTYRGYARIILIT